MVYHQEIIWMVRWGVQLPILAEIGKELKVIEKRKTSRRDEEKTDYGS